ncbi:hypothetical protein [Streptomyces sp. NPDC090025]|uniref:hypothetical protein n=1 Tax=Streptomyces sp. NPDC090025 TaxID=3365922 RepID=UPI003836F5CA
MAFPYPSGVFAAIAGHCDSLLAVDDLAFAVDVVGRGPTSLTPIEAREALRADADAPTSAAVWEVAIRRAQQDEADGRWRLLLLWLVLPRLTGTAHRVATRLRADRADVESELVLGILEAVDTVDPAFPGAVDALLAAARSRAWAYGRSLRRLVPVADIEAVTTPPRDDGPVEQVPPGRPAPPADATPHRPMPVSDLEGERIGALAAELKLIKIARQAQRGRWRHIGTVSLRPRGRRR